jgi:hypothetical protein
MKNELLLHSNTGCSLRAAIALLLLSGLVTPAFSAQTTPEPGNGAMLLAGFILILVGCAKTARLRSFAGVAAMLLIATSFAKADVIQFEGAPAAINDGQYYVTPYEITINGVDALVTCYDTFDGVNIGDTWDANLLTLGEAAASGFFSSDPNALARYEEVAWLEAQTYQNVAQEIGLQYAIWSVFGTAPGTRPPRRTTLPRTPPQPPDIRTSASITSSSSKKRAESRGRPARNRLSSTGMRRFPVTPIRSPPRRNRDRGCS